MSNPVTTPTQPPDPRVQRIADALDVWSDTVGYESHRRLARVLVEELGGREERKQRTFDEMPPDWKDVVRALDEGMPTWKEQGTAGNAIRAQQRENVETIQALRERAEVAERATAELDAQRKSAEQSARDLRENNATLRAELDAIKGTQRDPVAWMIVRTLKSGTKRTELANDPAAVEYANDDLTVTEITPLYEHPAPALPVVGACVIGVLTAKTDKETNSTSFHMDTSKYIPSKIVPPDGEYDIWLGAPLPTEGGK